MLNIRQDRDLIEFEGSAEDLLALAEGIKKAAEGQQTRPYENRVSRDGIYLRIRYIQGRSAPAL